MKAITSKRMRKFFENEKNSREFLKEIYLSRNSSIIVTKIGIVKKIT